MMRESVGGSGGVEGFPSEDDTMKMYAAMTMKPHPLPQWTFFLALSCFRMASIAQVLRNISTTVASLPTLPFSPN